MSDAPSESLLPGVWHWRGGGRLSLATIALAAGLALLAPLLVRLLGVTPDGQHLAAHDLPCGAVVAWPVEEQEEALLQFARRHPAAAARLAASLRESGLPGAVEWPADLPPAEVLLRARVANIEAARSNHALGPNPGLTWLASRVATWQRRHWLGTDRLGRDVLARLLYGARVSLGIGLVVALIAGFVGLLVGAVAGYFGGWGDAVLMRLTDALLALPILPVLIVVAAVDPAKVPGLGHLLAGPAGQAAKLVLILCLFSWMESARVVRGSVLAVKQCEYLLAARAIGATHARILRRHVLPNVMGPFLVALTLNVGHAILYESALSFLGLGLQPPTPSWGRMLADAQELLAHAPRLALWPGLLLFVVIISFNLLGDALHERLTPRLARR